MKLSASSPKLVLLAVEANRRCAFVREACATLRWDPPIVVDWRAFLQDPTQLDRALERASSDGDARPCFLRVDSPGEDWECERALLRLGAEQPERDTDIAPSFAAVEEVDALRFDRGRITLPRQWYRGFRAALQRVDESVRAARAVRTTSAPEDIAILFDKRATHARLAEDSVARTPLLGCPSSVDALFALMRERDEQRVFVKLWHGSSASGVVALRRTARGASATTSAELVRVGESTRLYNSLRVRRYTDERDVRAVLGALLREGAVVETWVAKATYDGDNFDLRVVTIAGEARHAVVRVGRSPMTNLHLGNRRGELERVVGRLGVDRWRAVRSLCASAASVFSGCRSLGVDVLLSPDLREARVIEVNAFGDLLPAVVDGGDDTYTATLRGLV